MAEELILIGTGTDHLLGTEDNVSFNIILNSTISYEEPINLLVAELMSVNHTFEFLGQNINYRNVQTSSFKCLATGANLPAVWQNLLAMAALGDYQEIVIQGVTFKGRITEFSAEAGIDIWKKPFSITIETLLDGDTSVFGTGDYIIGTGLTDNLRYLNSVKKDSSWEKSGNKYTYSHDISISVEENPDINATAVAKAVAAALLAQISNPQVLAAYPAFYAASGAKQRRESYNPYQREYSFSETFEFDEHNGYIFDSTLTISTGENGITVGSESGSIESLNGTPVKTILDNLLSTAYNRINAAYSTYYPNSLCILNSQYERRSISSDFCTNKLSYDISFNNDSKFKHNGVIWDYTNEVNIEEDGNYTVTENGNIKGYGLTHTVNLSRAKDFYSVTAALGIYSRTKALYDQFRTFLGNDCVRELSPQHLLTKRETFAESSSTVSYTYTYKQDSTVIVDESSLYRQIIVSVSDTPPLHWKNSFVVPNQPFEIVQSLGNSTMGGLNETITLISKQDLSLTQYLTDAKAHIVLPDFAEHYMDSATYSLSRSERKFVLNIVFRYVGDHVSKNNITIS